MPRCNVLDRQGQVLVTEYMDGRFFPKPPFSDDLRSHLDDIRNLELRDDDVFIVAFSKCGTHWTWEMVQMLRYGEVKYDERAKEFLMIDYMTKDSLDALPSPRTLNTHYFYSHLPKQVCEGRHKIILIYRDPRDACVSMYHHTTGLKVFGDYRGTFSDYIPLFLEGTIPFDSWFEYAIDWERVQKEFPHLPVLTLYYEEMKKNPVDAVKQLAKFLEVKASDELCAAIADACDFDKLKAAHYREKDDPLKDSWRKDHPGIYRKGQTGDWRNWFTQAESDQFDAFFARKMGDSPLYRRYAVGTS